MDTLEQKVPLAKEDEEAPEPAALAGQGGETAEQPAGDIPIESGEKKSVRGRWIKGLAAVILALAVVCGGYSCYTASACSYISVDAADASVELAVNRRGQVIDVRAVDEGSVILAQELLGDLDRMSVEEALKWTMTTLEQRGLLDDGRSLVIIGVTADNEKQAAALDEAVDHFVKTPGLKDVVALDVTPEQREEAARQQQSGGWYVYENQKPPGTEVRPGSTPQEEQTDAPQTETAPAETVPAAPETEEQSGETAPTESQTGDQAGSQTGSRPSAVRPQTSGGTAEPAQPGGQQTAPQTTGEGQTAPSDGAGEDEALAAQTKESAQSGGSSPEGQDQPSGEPASDGGAQDQAGGAQPGGGEPAPSSQESQSGGGASQGGGSPAEAGGSSQGGGGAQTVPDGSAE